jgi:hypothetical protein
MTELDANRIFGQTPPECVKSEHVVLTDGGSTLTLEGTMTPTVKAEIAMLLAQIETLRKEAQLQINESIPNAELELPDIPRPAILEFGLNNRRVSTLLDIIDRSNSMPKYLRTLLEVYARLSEMLKKIDSIDTAMTPYALQEKLKANVIQVLMNRSGIFPYLNALVDRVALGPNDRQNILSAIEQDQATLKSNRVIFAKDAVRVLQANTSSLLTTIQRLAQNYTVTNGPELQGHINQSFHNLPKYDVISIVHIINALYKEYSLPAIEGSSPEQSQNYTTLAL